MNQFVRINKADHPMHGMIGTVNADQSYDGFVQVRLLNASFQASFKSEDLQRIEKGTKVIVEHTISDFFRDSMMIAGGWTPLSRILDIVEEQGEHWIIDHPLLHAVGICALQSAHTERELFVCAQWLCVACLPPPLAQEQDEQRTV